MLEEMGVDRMKKLLLAIIMILFSFELNAETVKTKNILQSSASININGQNDLDKFLDDYQEIHLTNKIYISGSGTYDFRNIPFSYVGTNKKCRKSTSGYHPFIIIKGKDLTLKNLVIKKSSPDGLEVSRGSNVKFDNLDIQHSCDEGITVREKASIELENSRIVSYYNKGIIFYSNTKAKVIGSTISSEQAFSLASYQSGLNVLVENSVIIKHPRAKDGRLITGDNCKDVLIEIYKTSLHFMQQLKGTKNCKNIKIKYKR